jgi:hypothetical protein
MPLAGSPDNPSTPSSIAQRGARLLPPAVEFLSRRLSGEKPRLSFPDVDMQRAFEPQQTPRHHYNAHVFARPSRSGSGSGAHHAAI